jgi:glycerol-3-phosphate acyltransferase PlsY
VDIVSYLVSAAVAYLLGSIPTGFLVAKAKGLDIRSVGSGNIGATNVLRMLGKPAGIFVLVIDGLKGYVACAWASDLILQYLAGSSVDQEYLRIVAGIFVVLGHNYTCWLRFKGGKGIATSAGVLAALVPWTFPISFSIWIVVFALTRYVSLASIAAAFFLPFATWLSGYSLTLIIITGSMGALAIYKHKANIERLLHGTESRFGAKPGEVAR